MGNSFLIVGLNEIHVDDSGGFVGVRLTANGGEPVGLGLHPEMVQDLAYGLIRALADATKQGKLAQRHEPIGEGGIHTEPTPAGVKLTFDLPDGAARIDTSLTWDQAQQLGQRLIDLANDPENRLWN